MQTQLKIDRHHLTAHDSEDLDRVIEKLDRMAEHYEPRHLVVTIGRAARTTDVSVKMVLALGHRRLVCEESGPSIANAAHACVAVLSRRITLAKERVHRNHGERGVRRAKLEAALLDVDAIRNAVAARDYDGFRDALREAPEAVEAELARRLKRHPEADALLGDDFVIADLVEGVLHRAFDNFAARPMTGAVHDWLFHWIDPVLDEFVAVSRS